MRMLRLMVAGALLGATLGAPASAESRGMGEEAIARLYNRLTPEGKTKLGVPLSALKSDGHELARALLRPLADGRGPLSAEQVKQGAERAVSAEKAKVEQLMRHEVQLLGGIPVQPLGDPIDWFRAPEGDWQWPTHLSRHYWLLPVAYAYHGTGKPEYAQKVVDVLLNWVAKTPVGSPTLHNSVNGWSRGLAAAEGQTGEPKTVEGVFKGYVDGPWTSLSAHARVEYWSQLFQIITDAPALDNAAVAILLNSLLDDHRQIMLDFPRRMNQYQGVAASLVMLGLFYPDFAEATAAEKVGWQRLARHTETEVYPDGSLAEASPNYGAGMMLRLNHLVEMGEREGRSIPPLLTDRLHLAARYLALFSDPLGRSPRIAKGGGDVTGGLATLNRRLNDLEIAFVASRGKEGKRPEKISATFPWAGHHVFRSGWDDRATWLFFDAGPRGSGHHDTARLGVQLFANEEWLLTDPGYYSYSSEGEAGRMSAYFKTTAAHNAALVDGEGQISYAVGTSAGPNTQPGEYGWREADGKVQAEGTYDFGFGSGGKIPVVHHRRVTFVPAENVFVIADTFRGDGKHRIDLHWQLDPAAKIATSQSTAEIDRERTRMMLRFESAAPLKLSEAKGQKEPLMGWFSSTYGKLEPAPVLRVSTQAELPLTITTHIRISTK